MENQYRTELGTLVTERENEIVLETPVAPVAHMLEWLMRDVCSTPYAEVRS